MTEKLATDHTLAGKVEVNKRKSFFVFLRILVVALGLVWAVVWLSREGRWGKLQAIFHQMNLGIFAAVLGIFIISQVMIGLRWWLLLRTQSVFIRFSAAVRLHFLGLFYNNFMPSSVGGDLLRAWYVTRHTDKRFEAALSVFVDRIIGLLSTLVIAFFFYVLFMRGQPETITLTDKSHFFEYFIFLFEHKLIIIFLLSVLGAIFCLLLLQKHSRSLLRGVWLFIRVRVTQVLGKLKSSISVYCSRPLTLFEVFGLTVFLQIFTITGFWFLGVNLGITASIKYYYVFFTLTWVFGALPVSVGGAVVVEGFLVYLFTQFANVEAEAALALALCQRIIWMLASLPGAMIHLIGAHLPKDFFIDCRQSID